MTNEQGWHETLEDLDLRRQRSRSMGGEERLAKHRAKGKLDARARLDHLLDKGTFREFGTLVGGDVASDGIVTGSGTIDGAPVMKPVPGHDRAQPFPVGLGVEPAAALLVLAKGGIRDLETEFTDLRHVPVEELLTGLLVPLALDAPDVHRVLVGGNRVAVEVHERLPPAVERLLDEAELLFGTRDHGEDHVAPVEDVNDSSQQIFFMIRAYGAYEHLRSAFWETMAAASTSQAMTPTSPQERVG